VRGGARRCIPPSSPVSVWSPLFAAVRNVTAHLDDQCTNCVSFNTTPEGGAEKNWTIPSVEKTPIRSIARNFAGRFSKFSRRLTQDDIVTKTLLEIPPHRNHVAALLSEMSGFFSTKNGKWSGFSIATMCGEKG